MNIENTLIKRPEFFGKLEYKNLALILHYDYTFLTSQLNPGYFAERF